MEGAASGSIRIFRVGRILNGWVSYRVIVDNSEVGTVGAGQSIVVNAPAGTHQVQLIGRFPMYTHSNALEVLV